MAATELRSFRTFLLMQQFAAKEIGARIAQARREANGMTQEELAELLNVSNRSVQDYEAGTRIPWKHFSRLEQIFQRELEWFLHGQTAKPESEGAILTRLNEVYALLDRRLDLQDPTSRLAAIESQLAEISRSLAARA